MLLDVELEVKEEAVNWKITVFGILFLCFRIWFMKAFEMDDGSFHPEIFHTSYFISILISLSMVFSFRVKPLNTVAVAVFPSVIITLFFHDLPLLIDPSSGVFGGDHQIGGLLWWNFLTVHTPIPFLTIYFYLTRKETLSIEGYFMMFPILLIWFFILDDKVNGTVEGPLYTIVALSVAAIWTVIYVFGICKYSKGKDPLIAPVVKIRKISMIKS